MPGVDRRLIDEARRAAAWYHAELENRNTFVYCDDGFDLCVHWSAANFDHLTGLGYWKSRNTHIPVRPGGLYHDLLRPGRIEVRRLYYMNSEHTARFKSTVLLQALNPSNAKTVYEIISGVFLLGMGDDDYCLGLVKDSRLSSDARTVHRPKSIVKGKVEDLSGFRVTARHRIEQVETR